MGARQPRCKRCSSAHAAATTRWARTIFDSVLDSYPKRIDVLSVYIDMETRRGDVEAVRRLFERATDMRLSTKKMKFFYKKWLRFEAEQGTPDDVQAVRAKAKPYVESMRD